MRPEFQSVGNHLRFIKRAVLVLTLIALSSLSASHAYSVSTQDNAQEKEIRSIEPGARITREIAGGSTHTYRVTLAFDHFLRVTADQRDIDVLIRLLGPENKQLALARNILDPVQTERLSFVADSAGDYLLEVIALGTQQTRGSYELRIAPARIATPEDRSLTAAERICSEAEEQLAEGKATSIRQAIVKYEESLSLWQQAKDQRGEAGALQSLAMAYQRTGEMEKAIERLPRALSLYRAAGDRRGESQTLQGLGLMNYLSGDPYRALEYYDQSLPISKAINDRGGEATTLNNLGIIYSSMGDHQKALEYYGYCLTLQRALENKFGEGSAFNNIGEIYRTLGESERAIEYFEKSLVLRRETRDIRGEGATLNNIALVYSSLGEYQRAIEQYEKSLALRKAAGDRFGEATTLNNIGFVYHKLGDHNKALEFLNRALELRRAMAERRGEANTLHLIGSVYSSMNQPEKALEYFNRALPLSQSARYRIVEAATLYGIARIERNRGNLAEARARMDAALDIIEALRSRITAQELRETFFASRQDHFELYVDILMRLNDQNPSSGYAARAFEASERARARAMLDLLAESRADVRQGVDPSLLERERALQRQINSKESLRMQMASRRNAEKQIEAIEASLSNLLNEHKDIRAKIRASSPRYAALSEPQPLGLEQIQRLLDDQTLLLEYSLGDSRSYLWMVTPNSITSHALAGRTEIEKLARRVYELLTARNQRHSSETADQKRERVTKADDEYENVAAELSQMLLGPVAKELGNKRLLIVSQGALQYIPFGALPSPDSRLPLIARNEILSLPSASVLALLREDMAGRKQADRTVAVLADPVFDLDDPRVAIAQSRIKNRQPVNAAKTDSALSGALQRAAQDFGINGFRRLKFSRQEADSISALAAQSLSMKAVDFAASRTTALSETLSRYRIIHFATHGLINTERPELSGIVFSLVDENGQAQDGFLRLHEIYNLRLNADLVVLSACQSALGKEIKGEGLVGLVRGFMYAGAERVVASLWNVEDRTTAELMKRFYRNILKEGLSPASALRAAQIEMLREKQWESPYHWAGFIIQGEWR